MPRSVPELTELHKQCLRLIARRGSDNPISYRDVAIALRVHERKVRQAVQDLVMVFRMPVGSSYNPRRPGYYWLKTREEVRQVCGRFIRHGAAIIKRGRALGKLTDEEFSGQLRIEFPELGEK